MPPFTQEPHGGPSRVQTPGPCILGLRMRVGSMQDQVGEHDLHTLQARGE